MKSLLLYACGCMVIRDGSLDSPVVTSVGVCDSHRGCYDQELAAIAELVEGSAMRPPAEIDSGKMSEGLVDYLRWQEQQEGPVDGSA